MAGIEHILGGFAQGFGRARMMQAQREKDKEMTGLQKQLLQWKIKQQESLQKKQEADLLKQKRMETIENLIYNSPKFQKAFGLVPGAGEASAESYAETSSAEGPKLGKSFESPGVSDQMAAASMDPLMAIFAEKFTGVDFPEALRTGISQQQLGVSKRRAAIDEQRYNRGFSEKTRATVPTGSGGSQFLEFPKYGGSEGTARILGTSPAPTEFEEEERGGVTYRRQINKATKQPISKWRKISGKKGMAAEAAGKLGMVQSGLSDLQLAKEILMPGGKVNKKRLFEMAIPGGGLPKSEGREAKAYILNAMEGKIRIESGAAVPDQEMDRLAVRFMPSLLDSDKLIKSKMNRLESYLNGVIEKLDPNKNYTSGTEIITTETGEQFAWIPKGGGKTKMPDPLGIRE